MQVTNAINILKEMIKIPSYSFEEKEVADFLFTYLTQRGREISSDIILERIKNNIIMYNLNFFPDNKNMLLCSHIDTVKEPGGYTNPPFEAIEKDGKIYGLGANDDGASVVSQIETFFHLSGKQLNINLILVITAEEECSGPNGMDLVIKTLSEKKITNKQGEEVFLAPHFAILGEPTQMEAAIAERGLLVLDGTATGISGHAARNEGKNALYIALDDIDRLRNYKFEKRSTLMGDVKLTVTQLNCGTAHNVIPDKATYVVDIRPTEQYSNGEILELLQKEVKSFLKARNLTNKTSATPKDHILMRVIEKLGIKSYVSPTTSDWMRLDIPGIKMGPGESSRSHRADEYICVEEIREGIASYIKFIENL